MKRFIKQLLVFCSIGTLYIFLVIIVNLKDPFKVYGNYDTYYENSVVELNREYVCLQLFKKNNKKKAINSFIFGSSRSLAYKIPDWEKYLDEKANGFHFDATGEGIYGIYNKLNYLKKNNVEIKNALIILDYNVLKTVENRKGHLSISPPELSEEDSFSYYKEFIFATANWNFMLEFLNYDFFNKAAGCNRFIVPPNEFSNRSDNETADFYYGTDKRIALNEKGYYKEQLKKEVFYDRSKIKTVIEEEPISIKEKKLLKGITEILKSEKTNYKIVISPLYDQKKMSFSRLDLLKKLFGANNVYDFSGKNNFTNSIYNYYETSHYRTNVAIAIMDIIYEKRIYLD